MHHYGDNPPQLHKDSKRRLKSDWTFKRGTSFATGRSFYRCLNSILRFRTRPSDVVQLHLLMTHCAPILTYSLEILEIDTKACRLMRVAYNSIFRRVLSYRGNQSVSEVQAYFGYPKWEELWLKRFLNFEQRLTRSQNHLVLSLLFV